MRPQGVPDRNGFKPLIVLARMDGRELVAAVHAAARRHNLIWEALVPSHDFVDFAHEEAEDCAYAELAATKRALRDHICETYGITIRELASLAMP